MTRSRLSKAIASIASTGQGREVMPTAAKALSWCLMIGGPSADLPSRDELEAVFRDKYGDLNKAGWSPRRNWRFNYFQPSDVYEAAVKKAVFDRCAWLDVGGGSTIFPQNAPLATALVARALRVVAVDPSENVLENRFVHERVHQLL